MFVRVRKRFFTLMELLLVLGIVSLIAGFVGVNIRKMLQEQRFRTEVSQVVDQLRLAQDLMLIHDTNVYLKFIRSDTGFTYGLTFDNLIPQQWARELQRPHKKLNMIRYINFHDMNVIFDDSDKDEINIQFLSGGAVMSKGILVLKSIKSDDNDNVLQSFVWLSGSPQPLMPKKTFPQEYYDQDVAFATRLTQITQGEISTKEEKIEEVPGGTPNND